MNARRKSILTDRLERLKLSPSAKSPRGELTPAEVAAIKPVLLVIRRSLEQFGQASPVRIELSREEALALSYAFEAVPN
jgi:hypothetical protein